MVGIFLLGLNETFLMNMNQYSLLITNVLLNYFIVNANDFHLFPINSHNCATTIIIDKLLYKILSLNQEAFLPECIASQSC